VSDKIEVTITKWLQAETTWVLEKPASQEELISIVRELDGCTRIIVEDEDDEFIQMYQEVSVQGQAATLTYHEAHQYKDLEALDIKLEGSDAPVDLEDLYPITEGSHVSNQ
jgi:hypothetical protein